MVVVVAPDGVVLGVAVKVSVWPWLLLTTQPKKLLAPVMHTLSSGQHSPLPQSTGPMGGHTPWSCRAAWNWITARASASSLSAISPSQRWGAMVAGDPAPPGRGQIDVQAKSGRQSERWASCYKAMVGATCSCED